MILIIKFELKQSNNVKVEEALKKTGSNIETKLNNYLHKDGANCVIQSIISFMPISDRKKEHAKESNSLKSQTGNLSFTILPKGKFRYLVFPNDGIGKNNKVAQGFFERGLSNTEDKIFKDILKIIDETL